MKKMHGRLCIMIGAALLLAALSLVLYNLNKDSQGGKASQELLAELKLEMPQISSDDGNLSNNDLFKEYEDDEPDQDNFIEVNGRIYAGVIYIPSLQLELPVLSEWSYDNLDISPCRYSGSAFKGNLIIAAHNYRSHFGRLQELGSGDTIIFTDGKGIVYEYETVQTETVDGRDVEAMELGSENNWDLTLFTCTLSGQSRVTVRSLQTNN